MGKKILLVEDDTDLISFYQTLLQAKGYEVTSATNGEDGWTKLTTDSFDIVLLDIMMPKLDGVGFLKRKYETPNVKDVPAVVMTNIVNNEILSECSRLGAKYYILKVEVDPKEIPAILEKAIAEKAKHIDSPH